MRYAAYAGTFCRSCLCVVGNIREYHRFSVVVRELVSMLTARFPISYVESYLSFHYPTTPTCGRFPGCTSVQSLLFPFSYHVTTFPCGLQDLSDTINAQVHPIPLISSMPIYTPRYPKNNPPFTTH
jgi:hypothetical protein